MIEFLFFQKVIIENNVENDFKEFLKLADEQDELEWDESHFDGKILRRETTVTWVNPETSETILEDGHPDQTMFKSQYSFIKYLKNIKYPEEFRGMIPAVRIRLDEYLLNETKRSKYIKLLKSKYSEIINVGIKNLIFSKYLDLEVYLEVFKSKLELIIGEEIHSQESSSIKGHGLSLKLEDTHLNVLRKLYHFTPENHSIVDKSKSSEETFISAFNNKDVFENIYFLCKTKDLAYIIDCLYYQFQLSQSKRQFFKSIQDSGIFITNTGKILTASNISKNLSIGASPFKTHLDTFFKTVK